MEITFFILMGMLILSMLVPFVALYAVSLIKKKDYETHIKIQKRLFWTCILGTVILEIQIRMAGGSGNFVTNGTYASEPFFKSILIAHIIGAVLTYAIWALQLFMASRKRKAAGTFPGNFPAIHRNIGYATIAGLFYTAITALMVCTLAFFL